MNDLEKVKVDLFGVDLGGFEHDFSDHREIDPLVVCKGSGKFFLEEAFEFGGIDGLSDRRDGKDSDHVLDNGVERFRNRGDIPLIPTS